MNSLTMYVALCRLYRTTLLSYWDVHQNVQIVMLVIVVVVGFQTNGFTRSEPKAFIAWPKVKRKRKIVRRRVVVDDDGNATDDAGAEGNNAGAGKVRRGRRTRKED